MHCKLYETAINIYIYIYIYIRLCIFISLVGSQLFRSTCMCCHAWQVAYILRFLLVTLSWGLGMCALYTYTHIGHAYQLKIQIRTNGQIPILSRTYNIKWFITYGTFINVRYVGWRIDYCCLVGFLECLRYRRSYNVIGKMKAMQHPWQYSLMFVSYLSLTSEYLIWIGILPYHFRFKMNKHIDALNISKNIEIIHHFNNQHFNPDDETNQFVSDRCIAFLDHERYDIAISEKILKPISKTTRKHCLISSYIEYILGSSLNLYSLKNW